MSEQKDSLYKLHGKDYKKAGGILAEAFKNDPVWKYVLADCSIDQKRALFEIPMKYGMKYGKVYAPSSKLEGVAFWVPGHYATMTFGRILRSGAFFSAIKMGSEPAKKMEVLQQFDIDKKKNMGNRPYIYLFVIGVNPNQQGQGFGKKLLLNVLNDGNKSGLPVYLETSTEKNMEMYTKFGFKVIKKVYLDNIDTPHWEMIREPD